MKSYDYPQYVISAVKQWYLHNDEGISEERVRHLSPKTVLDVYLEWEGIYGYTSTIIDILEAKKK